MKIILWSYDQFSLNWTSLEPLGDKKKKKLYKDDLISSGNTNYAFHRLHSIRATPQYGILQFWATGESHLARKSSVFVLYLV